MFELRRNICGHVYVRFNIFKLVRCGRLHRWRYIVIFQEYALPIAIMV